MAGFTERVRQELSRTDHGRDCDRRAELAALVRGAGSLHVTGGADAPDHVTLRIATTSGAVARRSFALASARYGQRPEIRVRAPGGVRRRSTYEVHLPTGVADVARDLVLLGVDGRLTPVVPEALVRRHCDAVAYLRGAVLAGASFSTPGRRPHLEIAVTDATHAASLATLATRVLDRRVASDADRARVVSKSGETIGALLAAIGAGRAFLDWDETRLRHELRNEATRLANADAANVRRAIDAATAQTRVVEQVVAATGWEALDPVLRSVALARLANPEASLAELGELLDPPLSKAAVHRRLERLAALARVASPPERPEGHDGGRC